jgi:4-hydroxybenzoyl-CoA thioesterase
MLTAQGVVGYPMVDVSAKFMRPAAYGDDVILEVAAPEFGNSSFTIAHRLLKNGHVCVTGIEKRVWTIRDNERPGGMRAERVPDDIRGKFLV